MFPTTSANCRDGRIGDESILRNASSFDPETISFLIKVLSDAISPLRKTGALDICSEYL
jgi:hypothetical protein